MGKTIAITNQKGGTGKTTVTLNFGACLAAKGYRVLMVDFDPQGNLTFACGIKDYRTLKETIANPLLHVITEESDETTVPIRGYRKGLYFVPANRMLSNVNILLVQATQREYILKTILEPLKGQYDYILIDCAPSLSIDLINAFVTADEVLIVSAPASFSTCGTEEISESIAKVQKNLNTDLTVAGVLFNKIDRRNNFTNDIIDQMRMAWQERMHVFATEIPGSIRVEESHPMAQPMIEYEVGNKVTKGFVDFTEEYLNLKDPGAEEK